MGVVSVWCMQGASEGGVCPNIFSMLVGSNEGRLEGGEPIMAHLFVYLVGPHGSPLMFLPAPNQRPLLKFPLTSVLGGLHPSLEGRGDVAISLSVGDLKRMNVVSIQQGHTEGGGGNDGTKGRERHEKARSTWVILCKKFQLWACFGQKW